MITIKKMNKISVLTLALPVLLLGIGCGKNSRHAEISGRYAQIDMASAGTVAGTIHFAGQAPARIKLDVSQDPGCVAAGGEPIYTEQYLVNDGKMANVFVYVKDGLGNKIYAPPASPVVVDQKGCRYVPHVVGVMAGQPVEVRNSDPTMHDVNVQPGPGGNPPSDASQAPHGAPLRRTFLKPETMIALRCAVHPWMEAYINVVAGPFFAVSDAQGHYLIRGLPPGTYTLVADQEMLGTQQQTVSVTAHQTSTADFTFSKK
jgi:hypothetical protein